MADTKLSALTELAATPASDDEVYIRDVSEAAADESKRITIANLVAASGGLDSGLIVMWHGTIGNIPSGFLICDGNNSTPNLLTKFVQGVDTAGTNPGTTGGTTAKTTSGHQHEAAFIAQASEFTFNETPWFGTGTSRTPSQGLNRTASTVSRAVALVESKTDDIPDIRPLFYDIAFLMKS